MNECINIIGAGAMGHLWAAYLLKANLPFRLCAREPRSATNFQLITDSNSRFYAQKYHSLATLSPHEPLIICVKAPDLETLCLQISELGQHPNNILLLMNGMGLAETVKKYLPLTQIWQASTTHGAYISLKSGTQGANATKQLHHTGKGKTLIGDPLININSNLSKPRSLDLDRLIRHLNQALPLVRADSNYQKILWQKLLINTVINPITCLYQVNNGTIASDIGLRQKARELTRELAPIIKIYLAETNWQSFFEQIVQVARATSNNISSMLQDRQAGRKTEIEFITGYLLTKAKQNQISLPLHHQLYRQIKRLEDNL